MAQTFSDLGLRPEVADAAAAAGFAEPSPLQRAAIPVLRRGGNAVLHASAGAGVVAAYGLALLDRLAADAEARDAERGVAALVLVTDSEAAVRTAESLARFAGSPGLSVAALEPGWPAATEAAILVATPAAALGEVRAARLKLDAVVTFVLDGASTLLALVAEDALETLAATVPSDAQRVVATGELTEAVERYVERHARRALHIPPRQAAPEPRRTASPAAGPATVENAGVVLEYIVASESAKTDALAARLAADDTPAAEIACRTPARAQELARALKSRGFMVSPGEAAGRLRVGGEGAGPTPAVSYDVPFDAETLAARHGAGGLVFVSTRELAHLRRLAAEAEITLRAREVAAREVAEDLATFRERLRSTIEGEDLAAQLLVLEPLFQRHSAAEVAAAASALLRRRTPPPSPVPKVREAAAPVSSPPRSWTRLFLSSGQRDGLRPGDLVGAITGESGIAGDQIGKIEIRDTFSIAEVASEAATRVIQAMNGITLKGRSLRVDYDRPPAKGARRSGGR